MKVLYHYDKGCNYRYLQKVLQRCQEMFSDFTFTLVRPSQYLEIDQNQFDILIYQTFPDEHHSFKFDAEMISRTDNKFSEFKGIKVLHDSHDNGELDAFSRMNNGASKLPRIKSMSSFSYLDRFNVILNTPPVFLGDTIADLDDRKRDVPLHCCFSMGHYPHRLREDIWEILKKDFSHVCNFKRIPMKGYREFLRGTQMSVSAPGTGACSNGFYSMILCGTLAVHEKTLNNHQLLPFGTLMSGQDYVSFSIKTLKDTLNWLLKDPVSRDRIRMSGYRKLKEGHDIRRATVEFHKRLSEL